MGTLNWPSAISRDHVCPIECQEYYWLFTFSVAFLLSNNPQETFEECLIPGNPDLRNHLPYCPKDGVVGKVPDTSVAIVAWTGQFISLAYGQPTSVKKTW